MNTQGLYYYQIPAAKQLLEALRIHHAAVDFSSTGLGKTFVACAVIRELDLPTLVVAPKISLTSWQRTGESMGVGFCCKNWEMLRTGNLAYGQWQFPPPKEREKEFFCTVCQCSVNLNNPPRCRYHSGVHCIEGKLKDHDYGRFTFNDAVKFLVFDEIHYAAGIKSLNSDLVIAARRQNILTLGLSATAAADPTQMRALGYLLGLHCLVGPGGFYPFAIRHSCRRPAWGGLEFYGSEEKRRSVMAKIHSDLFPSRGVRVRTSDIPNFPACQITAELFDLESSGKLTDLYETMSDAISLLNTMKLTDKNAEHPLTVLLRASMEIELLKLPIFLALRQDALDEGKSVALFVQYRQTLLEIEKRTKCVTVFGGQDPDLRQGNIDLFQANKVETIALNIAAGGVAISLHDLLGRPRVGICSLHPSATKTKQMFGRLARAGGLSPARYRIPLVANSPEERLHKRLASKLNCLDALLDSDLTACNLPLVAGNLAEILEEKP